MANMTAARAALATRLATVTGVRVSADGTAPGQINPDTGKPVAVITPEPGVFMTRDSQGSYTFNFAVKLIVSTALTDAAQTSLDGFIDDVFGALENDTLDDTLTLLAVVGRSYGALTYAGVEYPVGCEFAVAVGVV